MLEPCELPFPERFTFLGALKERKPSEMLKALRQSAKRMGWPDDYWRRVCANGHSVAWLAAETGDFDCFLAMAKFTYRPSAPNIDQAESERRDLDFANELSKFAAERSAAVQDIQSGKALVEADLGLLCDFFLTLDAENARERAARWRPSLVDECRKATEAHVAKVIASKAAEAESAVLLAEIGSMASQALAAAVSRL